MMRLKAHFLLTAVILAFVSLPTPACSHDDRPEGDGDVDWSSFVPFEGDTEAPLTIQQAEDLVGFQLVLPSYLPEGMMKSYYVSATPAFLNEEPQSVTVGLFPANLSEPQAPQITIYESPREPDDPPLRYSGREAIEVGGREVHCLLEIGPGLTTPELSTPEPQGDGHQYSLFECGWETDKLRFDVEFRERLPETARGDLPPEMRGKALKVIASMIEDPSIP
jgi:hypothetical protein